MKTVLVSFAAGSLLAVTVTVVAIVTDTIHAHRRAQASKATQAALARGGRR